MQEGSAATQQQKTLLFKKNQLESSHEKKTFRTKKFTKLHTIAPSSRRWVPLLLSKDPVKEKEKKRGGGRGERERERERER